MTEEALRQGCIHADWPAPGNVRALTTTRAGGVSTGPYASLNLADHVGDAEAAVAENRRRLRRTLNLPAEPCWLQQCHGIHVVDVKDCAHPQADAAVAKQTAQVCAVLTADCLPVLMCDRQGEQVAAAHAGWRGLAGGILQATVTAMERQAQDILVWLGPAIGPAAFEVGEDVYHAFTQQDVTMQQAFTANRPGHWHADLYRLARLSLQALGVAQVYGANHCTFTDRQHYYSYRRDGTTGRMASLIWLV